MKKPVEDFMKTKDRALRLANRAAGRSDPKSLRDMAEAARLYLGLTRRLKGRTPLERWDIRRHYYRTTGQHLRVIALGKAEIARGNKAQAVADARRCGPCAAELKDYQRWVQKRPGINA